MVSFVIQFNCERMVKNEMPEFWRWGRSKVIRGRTDENIERTDENIEKLIEAVVDSWDMDTLIGYAHDHMEVFYRSDDGEEQFQEDWESTID